MCEFSADSKHEENGNRKRETGGKQKSEWYSEWRERVFSTDSKYLSFENCSAPQKRRRAPRTVTVKNIEF